MRQNAVSPRICVVEDDDAVRDSLRGLLECEDFEVADFASSEEFISRGLAEGASCLVVDVHMPGMSGLELLERLRQAGVRTPAIVISGRTDPEIRRRAAETGARFFEKPFLQDDLLVAVRSALGRG